MCPSDASSRVPLVIASPALAGSRSIAQPVQLLDSVASALTRAGMHDRAGEFYELLNDLSRALDSYIRGSAYRKAVELARRSFPGRVVELQEQWGDYLVSQKQIDMAINHYIEAGSFQKAVEAAISARQWSKAVVTINCTALQGRIDFGDAS